jgi:hypothetical protein
MILLHSQEMVDVSDDRARIVSRLDQSPSHTASWFINQYRTGSPPEALHAAWLSGDLANADSLRIEVPIYEQGRRVLRWGLKGTDSTLAWMARGCAGA